MSTYPQTVLEVLEPTMSFPADVVEAMRRFTDAGPWSGTVEQRKQKLRELNRALAQACNIAEPQLVFERLDGGSSGGSYYAPRQHRIVMVGRLSVVTYLHELAHARGLGEREACRWSINLFRQTFPRQYGRLVHRGHMLMRACDASPTRVVDQDTSASSRLIESQEGA
jgi:hypothetical protein